MIKKIDHIAIAVRDLKESRKKIEELYGGKFIGEGVNAEGNYRLAVFRVGENTVSMLESMNPEGFVAKHIERFGEGVQHMGVIVEDLNNFIKHLNSKGIKTSAYSEIPGVRKEVLVGAKNAFGTILQFIEWTGECKEASPEERIKKALS